MSDLEQFTAMLRRSGIEFRGNTDGAGQTTVQLETYSGNVCGYSGFYTNFIFDEQGALSSVEIWE